MSHNDVPGRSSRPSLLSEQAQAPQAADSQSILNKLDGRASPSAAAPAPRKPGRMRGAVAGMVAAVVLGGGALAWALQDDNEEDGAAQVAVAAAPVPAPPAMPAALPDEAAKATGDGPAGEQPAASGAEVSAATILDEVPGGAVAATAAALAAGTAAVAHVPARHDGKDELAALIDKPAAPAARSQKSKADTDKLRAKSAARKKAESARLARKDKAHADDRKAALAAAHRKKPAAKAPAQVDTDVALLAALLAHSKASGTPKAGKTAAEYRRCSTLDSADANKCRARLCEASAKASAECKTLRADKAAG